MNRFGLTLALGIATFLITGWLAAISPKQVAYPVAGDMRDPIIAFEMVTNEEQLVAAIGGSRAEHEALRDAIDTVNRIDFLYMTVYGLFIAAFFWAVAQAKGDRRWLAGSALALVASLADARETAALLALTQDGGEVAADVQALMVSTWIKWFALGIAAALAGLAMLTTPEMRVMRHVGAAAGGAALVLTVAGYVDQIGFPQWMAVAIFFVWLLQTIYAFRRMRMAAG
ncbi:MAG: hypothetical protein RH982_12420 [Parvibaculum sp.]